MTDITPTKQILNPIPELPIPYSATHHIIDSSKLATFLECPRKFFYEYLLGWRSERPNNHLVFGQAWHLAMEHIMLHGHSNESIMTAYDLFECEYRKIFGESTDELFWPKTPARAFEALGKYSGTWCNEDERYETLYTEIAGSVQMTSDWVLNYRMDSIVRDKRDGLIKSMEHKTGSQFNSQWESQWPLSLQVGTYTHVLMSMFGQPSVYGVIMNGTFFKKVKGTRGAETFEFHRVPCRRSVNQMQVWYHNTLAWMQSLFNELNVLSEDHSCNPVMHSFPMNPTACSKYFGCSLHDFCNTWKNPLQNCDLPPIGMIVEHWDPSVQPSKQQFNIKGDLL